MGLNQHFIVSVIVDGSDAMNGFLITLLTDKNVLQPSGVILGNLLTNTHNVVKCIGGVNQLGPTACPSTDNASTIDYGVAGDISSAPTTGVLFQADYLVVGNSAKSPIIFQTGCSSTSVSGGICVTIQSGTAIPLQENAQTAKFTNIVTGYFDLVPSTRTMQVSKGDPPNLFQDVVVTSLNTFSGTVAVSVSCSPAGPICAIVPPTDIPISTGNDGTAVLNVTVPKTVSPGTYTLNITGTSGTLPPNSVTIQLIVPTPDFAITPSPSSLKFNVTASGLANITISSSGNFNGTVTLSVKTNDPALASATLLYQTLTLSAKGTNSTKLTVTATIYGGYSVNVTATSGSLSHSSTISITATLGTGASDCKVTARDIGDYSVTVTAVSGVGSRTSVHAVTFPVTVIAKGFSVALSTNVETVPVSGSTSLNVTIVGNGIGLNDTINVKLEFSSSNLSPLPNINPPAENVSITPTSQNSTITATITASSSTP